MLYMHTCMHICMLTLDTHTQSFAAADKYIKPECAIIAVRHFRYCDCLGQFDLCAY